MKKAFIYCFDKWWPPLLFFALIAVLLIINGELNISFLKKPLQFLSNVSVFVLLVSFFYQLYMRRYLKGFITIFIILATVIISFMSAMVDGDHWADDLKIPDGIQIENPIDRDNNSVSDSILKYNRNSLDLVLYKSGQPGMYKYDFWIGKIESGIIYLKAFEITQEIELSKDNLKPNTQISIYNPTDTLDNFGSFERFKIYEGDWGKFYVARFEVWFKPSSGGQEKKLFQKNFRIEGWMH